MDNIREQLIELLETVVPRGEVLCDGEVLVSTRRVADHLIANGVTLVNEPPKLFLKREPTNEDLLRVLDSSSCIISTGHESVVPIYPDRWIPVTERLPEYSNGHVLVTDGERVKISCRNAFYNTAMGETRCAQGYGAGMSVTHWMPLPVAPEVN